MDKEPNMITPGAYREYGAFPEAPVTNTKKEPEVFTGRETVSAFIAAALGFFIMKLFAAPLLTEGRMGLGTAAVLIGAIIFTFIYPSKNRITFAAAVRMIIAAAFSVNIFLCSNRLIQFLDTAFVLMIISYDALSRSGERFYRIRRFFPADMLASVFVLPFTEWGACHSAVMNKVKSTKTGNGIKNALLGLAMAVPVTVVVYLLLISADSGNFTQIIENLFGNFFEKFISFIVQLGFGLPVGYYIYGMCRSSAKGNADRVINDENIINTAGTVRFLPYVAGVFSVLPVCVLYVIFFISQQSYYMSAFFSKLPSDMESYSDYARMGFFELCFVAVINLILIIGINIFCKMKEDGKKPVSIRVMSCTLCVFTLMLIATAVSKMLLYINVYGLTLQRVYPTWFMLLLALIFIGIFAANIVKKTNLARYTVTVFTIMLGILSFSGVDGLIAGYNAQRYLDGTLKEYDLSVLRQLSCGAVPQAAKVREKMSSSEKEGLDSIINRKLRENERADLRTLTVEDILAEKAVKEEQR